MPLSAVETVLQRLRDPTAQIAAAEAEPQRSALGMCNSAHASAHFAAPCTGTGVGGGGLHGGWPSLCGLVSVCCSR